MLILILSPQRGHCPDLGHSWNSNPTPSHLLSLVFVEIGDEFNSMKEGKCVELVCEPSHLLIPFQMPRSYREKAHEKKPRWTSRNPDTHLLIFWKNVSKSLTVSKAKHLIYKGGSRVAEALLSYNIPPQHYPIYCVPNGKTTWLVSVAREGMAETNAHKILGNVLTWKPWILLVSLLMFRKEPTACAPDDMGECELCSWV